MPKTLGTHRDTLAILLRAGEKDETSGLVFDGNHHSYPVLVVTDTRIRDAAGVDRKAFVRAIAAIQLRDAWEAKDSLAACNARARLIGVRNQEEYDKELGQLKKQVPPEMFAKLKAAGLDRWPGVSPSDHPYDEHAHIMAAGVFTAAMTQARVVIWLRMDRHKVERRRGKLRALMQLPRIEPGILVPDVETALYVRAALRDLRACPCCNTPFLPARPDQHYCSLRCRETHRQRRRRSKKRKP